MSARLEIIYFEWARPGAGRFAWIDGAEGDHREVHHRLREIVRTGGDSATRFGRVVRQRDRVLVEVAASQRGIGRPATVTVVVDGVRDDTSGPSQVAREAAEVLDKAGLLVDVETLTGALAHGIGGRRAFEREHARLLLLAGLAVVVGIITLIRQRGRG